MSSNEEKNNKVNSVTTSQPAKSQSSSSSSSSSLLLNESNLAWSQPAGFALATPAPNNKSNVNENSDDSKQHKQQEPGQQQQQQNNDNNNVKPVQNNDTSIQMQKESEQNAQPAAQNNNNNNNNLPSVYDEEFINRMDSNSDFDPFNIPIPPPNQPAIPLEPYQEVYHHWFYARDQTDLPPDDWQPFSMLDSQELETAFRQNRLDDLIPVNGTRFDVRLRDRLRYPVYWEAAPNKIQRCSWFYKRESDFRFIPYPEDISEILETNYRECCESNQWHRRIELNNVEFVVFYAPNSVYHYLNDRIPSQTGWTTLMSPDPNTHPRYAYRGPWTIKIEPERDEPPSSVRHLIFFIHGIGEFCDLSFRSLKDVVDDFRNMTAEIMQTHFRTDNGRIELLPISWHQALHTKSLDERLQEITLPSITRLRSFNNSTILDALFYTSQFHSATILNFVATELNRYYGIFLKRNPYFVGKIALCGHSLGSLILFDLLSSQIPPRSPISAQLTDEKSSQALQLHFRPECLFALGSPLPAFLIARGVQSIEKDFSFPTCPGFFNIFHPYDPIAYRFEPLIDREFVKLKPVLVPHHRGRKRIHLALKDSIQRVGTDLKEKLMSGLKGAISSIYGLTRSQEDVQASANVPAASPPSANPTMPRSISIPNALTEHAALPDMTEEEVSRLLSMDFGKLNRGRRLDYVLQERPFEIVNEYVFAITSHGCYWFNEDVSLLMLKELLGDPQETIPKPPVTPPPPRTSPIPAMFPRTSSPTTQIQR